MRRAVVLISLLLAVLMGISAPFLALAEPSPFCADETPPKLDQAFATLAAVVAERVGTPIECAHVEQATGDLQQATAGGLFYLRKSTSTATFTDGADHWAVRGVQSLHWTTSEADPPSTAEIRPLDSAASQPGGTAVAPVKSAIAILSDTGGTTLAVALVAVGLVLCVGVALLLQRQRARAYPRASTSAQLIAARATGTAGGLSTGLAPFAPSVSVGELQSAITDIGRNRVTEQADVVLRADPEAMIWQGSPSALAIILPPLARWLVIYAIAFMIRSWVASLIAGPANAASASTLEWVSPAIALLGMLWEVTVAWLRIFTTKYRATRQRLEITRGIFGQTTVTHELFELRNALIARPFFYRIFGVGNLTLTSRTKGAVQLNAIRKPEGVRDILRSSGQIEAARLEKAEWR